MKKLKNNNIFLYSSILFFLLTGMLFFTACEKEESYSTPKISKIRAIHKDSTLTTGELGQMVVIEGQNFNGLEKVYFNSEAATINLALTTDKHIIVNIPNQFPTEITNSVKVQTKGGSTEFNFEVEIPSPVAESFDNAFQGAGLDLNISGQFFYNLTKVIFPGNVEGTIVEYTPELLTVKVPEGAQTGKVKVVSVAGEGETTEIFRNNSYMSLNFDDLAICWGTPNLIDSTSSPEPVAFSGNYARITDTEIPEGSWWNENWVIAQCGGVEGVTGAPSDWVLKFEINVLSKWYTGWFEMYLGKDANDDDITYNFQPWADNEDGEYKTNGWVTVSVPCSNFAGKNSGTPLSDMSLISEIRFNYQNPGPDTQDILDICFDNIRFEPAVTE